MSDIIALFSALGLGALHSLEPGHGKGMMGAYLAVSRSRTKDILTLGATSALTHTAVVLALALGLHTAAVTVSSGSGLPAAQFEKYVRLFSGLLILFIGFTMLRRAVAFNNPQGCGCGCHGHGTVLQGTSRPLTGAFLVGLSNGIIPCPGSLAVILMSLNTQNIWWGISMVLVFGIGGALSLMAVGLVFVRLYAATGFSRGGRLGRVVALASSCLIMTIGIFTMNNALY